MAELETVPAKAAPENGVVRDLHQERPRGLLPAPLRARVAEVLRAEPNWAGTVLLIDAESHWVQVSADEIVSFQSALTPRLAGALGAMGGADEGAIAESLSQPERLAVQLRSAELDQDAGRIIGHLIGAELAAMRAFWLGADMRLIGEGALARAYEAALKAQGAWVSRA